jgi:hypothetical protein
MLMIVTVIVYITPFVLLLGVETTFADNSFFTTTGEINFASNKGEWKSTFVEFYGLFDGTTISFVKSDLVGKNSDELISSQRIKLDETSDPFNFTLHLNEGDRKKVKVSVLPDKEGSFSGNIFLGNNKNGTVVKLPISLTTFPNWPLIIAIFIVGYGISAILWAWKNNGSLQQRFDEIKKQARFLSTDFETFRDYVNAPYRFLIINGLKFRELRNELNSSKIPASERVLGEIRDNLEKMTENFDANKVGRLARMYGIPEEALVNSIMQEAIAKRDQKIELRALGNVKFKWWSVLFNRKTVVFNVTAITLGLIVGLGTFFQQEFLKTFYSMDWFSAIIIFSLGAGVENLKQILEKLYKNED